MQNEINTSPEFQQKAVQIQLPADLLTQLEEVKAQAKALSGGNPDWLSEVLLKEKGTINLRNIPEKWISNPELLKRLNLFLWVSEENYKWAKKRANKFYIRENTFDFPEIGLKLCIGDYQSDEIQYESIEKKGKSYVESVPTIEELLYVWEFIESSGNISKIRDFLGIKEEDYWARETYENDSNEALFVLFHNGVDSHSTKDKFKRLRLKYL